MSAPPRFQLPPDVRIVPAGFVDASLRAQLQDVTLTTSDFIVGRANARVPSSVIDRDGVALLELFKRPTTIAEAIIQFGKLHNRLAESVLEDAYPFLSECVRSNLLVAEGSAAALPILSTFASGDRIGSVRVEEVIRVTIDTEVYAARDARGLRRCVKVARIPKAAGPRALILREVELLRRIDGSIAPTVCESGRQDYREYVVLTWHAGATIDTIVRRTLDRASRQSRLKAACAIASAYATLHRRGVVHGDVNPTNIILGRDGRVTLVDFAFGTTSHAKSRAVTRGAAPFFQDPALAAATAAKAPSPPLDAASDQYALGALLYLVLTGRHYVNFSADQATMLSQVCHELPIPFAEQGVEPWPSVERILVRMLSKSPGDRFVNVGHAARALSNVAAPNHKRQVLLPSRAPGFTERFVRRAGLAHGASVRGVPHAPFASLNAGAAGVALALYRIAGARRDGDILAAADVWVAIAQRAQDHPEAFAASRHERQTPAIQSSLYHGQPGLHIARAFVEHALGDVHGCAAATDAFLTSITLRRQRLDVTHGLSGALLGCALLADLPGLRRHMCRDRLIAKGNKLARAISARLCASPLESARSSWPLGMAHGWAGFLYALTRWSQVLGRPLSGTIVEQLDRLGDRAVRVGSELRWAWSNDPHSSTRAITAMPGWCGGGAGFVFLWRLAAERTGERRFERLALGAARHAWSQDTAARDLCCGAAGRAYAMLAMWRATAERIWLDRARSLADRAVTDIESSHDARYGSPDGLMRGASGVAVLLEELQEPLLARMPLVEREPWPAPSTETSDA